MELDSDVLIVGGGLNGPVLALVLAQAGLSVTLIDALPAQTRDRPGFDGRAYALALTTKQLLQAAGVWDRASENAQPMLDIKVSDGRPGEGPSPFFMHFDHAEIEEGPMGFIIEDRHLRAAMSGCVRTEKGIQRIDGEEVTAQRADVTGVAVTLASGKIVRARVLIGCDGRGSGTARRAGITRSGWDYGQSALVCAVVHEQQHDGVAHQFFMPSGPLAILPLPGNRSSIVWTEADQKANRINALSNDDYMSVLRPRFGDFLGDITLAGDRFSYPLSLSLADTLMAERTALVGDAAHGVHPIAGQGLNAGMRDVAALAQVLAEAARRGEDIGSPAVLTRYQQWRRFDNATVAYATDMFNRLFSNDNPILRGVRDVGMGIVNKVPTLRRGFIREAAGLTGDLPRLMRGEPL